MRTRNGSYDDGAESPDLDVRMPFKHCKIILSLDNDDNNNEEGDGNNNEPNVDVDVDVNVGVDDVTTKSSKGWKREEGDFVYYEKISLGERAKLKADLSEAKKLKPMFKKSRKIKEWANFLKNPVTSKEPAEIPKPISKEKIALSIPEKDNNLGIKLKDLKVQIDLNNEAVYGTRKSRELKIFDVKKNIEVVLHKVGNECRKSYRCKLCEKIFFQPRYTYRHVREVHKTGTLPY